ncbi:hypothetical protein GCM10022419_116520 [Nonomuraea rosea]|uniref:NAD(P)-binding domain-containing protein n=1 Tax=Nonomuraea rosea TaxID=638574 RepID=A0ABP6ZK01_9ACTN
MAGLSLKNFPTRLILYELGTGCAAGVGSPRWRRPDRPRVVVRNPSKLTADVSDPDLVTLASAIEGADAVLSALGRESPQRPSRRGAPHAQVKSYAAEYAATWR